MLPDDSDDDPIAAFAQQLGIHPDEDAEFGWLAEVGLQSPLPPRWTRHADPTTGYYYYVDHDRQVSSWENPLVPYLRRVVEIGRAYLQKRTGDFFEEQKGILWHQHKHDLDCWNGPFSDAEGRSYYVNNTSSVSSWQDPRVDAQYIFELESGLLQTLAEVLPPPEADTTAWGEPGEAWKTRDGAEVLTLDVNSNSEADTGASHPHLTRRLTLSMAKWSRNNNRDEHVCALEKMTHTAEWLRSTQQDDLETQRLRFARKVEERKQRRQRLAHKLAGSQDSASLQERTLLSDQPLGPMPGQERCSPTSGLLSCRPVPRPLQATGLQPPLEEFRPTGTDTPNGPKPATSPSGDTPASPVIDDTPATASPGSDVRIGCSPFPPSPLDLQLPPPPPPLDAKGAETPSAQEDSAPEAVQEAPAPLSSAPAPLAQAVDTSGKRVAAVATKQPRRLFATLAAAAADATK